MSESMCKEGPDQFDVYQSTCAENEVIPTWSKTQADEVSCTLTRGKTGTLVAAYGRYDSTKNQYNYWQKKHGGLPSRAIHDCRSWPKQDFLIQLKVLEEERPSTTERSLPITFNMELNIYYITVVHQICYISFSCHPRKSNFSLSMLLMGSAKLAKPIRQKSERETRRIEATFPKPSQLALTSDTQLTDAT